MLQKRQNREQYERQGLLKCCIASMLRVKSCGSNYNILQSFKSPQQRDFVKLGKKDMGSIELGPSRSPERTERTQRTQFTKRSIKQSMRSLEKGKEMTVNAQQVQLRQNQSEELFKRKTYHQEDHMEIRSKKSELSSGSTIFNGLLDFEEKEQSSLKYTSNTASRRVFTIEDQESIRMPVKIKEGEKIKVKKELELRNLLTTLKELDFKSFNRPSPLKIGEGLLTLRSVEEKPNSYRLDTSEIIRF